MTECQIANAVVRRLEREETLTQFEQTHAGECAICGPLVGRARSLDQALARATGSLATADLPAGTFAIARQTERRSTTRRLAIATMTAAVMLVALTAAAQGLLRPTFSDEALRTDPAAVAAFEECLADGGYTPRPIATAAPESYSDARLAYERVAMRCMVESGIGEVDGDDPAEVAWANAIATGITQCLRDGGWDIPDPKLEPMGRYLVPPSGTISDDPAIQEEFNRDLEACFTDYGMDSE